MRVSGNAVGPSVVRTHHSSISGHFGRCAGHFNRKNAHCAIQRHQYYFWRMPGTLRKTCELSGVPHGTTGAAQIGYLSTGVCGRCSFSVAGRTHLHQLVSYTARSVYTRSYWARRVTHLELSRRWISPNESPNEKKGVSISATLFQHTILLS